MYKSFILHLECKHFLHPMKNERIKANHRIITDLKTVIFCFYDLL